MVTRKAELAYPGGAFVQTDLDRRLVVRALMAADRSYELRSTGQRADEHIALRRLLARARETIER